MSTKHQLGIAVVAELVQVLTQHRGVHCAPSVAEHNGLVTLSVTFHPGDGISDQMEILSLGDELRFVQDMAQMRALAAQYEIDSSALEPLLPVLTSSLASTPDVKLTLDELTDIIEFIEYALRHASGAWPNVRQSLDKLKRMQQAEIF